MSLQGWLDEFAPPLKTRATRLEMVEWSIRKWVGLRWRNRKKHGHTGIKGYCVRFAGKTYEVSAKTCPLCVRYTTRRVAHRRVVNCKRCPLALARSGIACDHPPGASPWDGWGSDLNPEPMIRLLRKARRMLLAEAEKRKGRP